MYKYIKRNPDFYRFVTSENCELPTVALTPLSRNLRKYGSRLMSSNYHTVEACSHSSAKSSVSMSSKHKCNIQDENFSSNLFENTRNLLPDLNVPEAKLMDIGKHNLVAVGQTCTQMTKALSIKLMFSIIRGAAAGYRYLRTPKSKESVNKDDFQKIKFGYFHQSTFKLPTFVPGNMVKEDIKETFKIRFIPYTVMSAPDELAKGLKQHLGNYEDLDVTQCTNNNEYLKLQKSEKSGIMKLEFVDSSPSRKIRNYVHRLQSEPLDSSKFNKHGRLLSNLAPLYNTDNLIVSQPYSRGYLYYGYPNLRHYPGKWVNSWADTYSGLDAFKTLRSETERIFSGKSFITTNVHFMDILDHEEEIPRTKTTAKNLENALTLNNTDISMKKVKSEDIVAENYQGKNTTFPRDIDEIQMSLMNELEKNMDEDFENSWSPAIARLI